MEFIINNTAVLDTLPPLAPNGVAISSASQPFVEANTIQMAVNELQDEHIIPVWSANNEPLISHAEFVETTWEQVNKIFKNETILRPNIRVSHAIKGRVPEARNKPAKDLQPWEQTLYYERMAFVIEIPSIYDEINGNMLALTIGGVKSYNLDNLYSKRPSGDQQFQLFIGFQNKVCCNMCISTDGYKQEFGVKSIAQLKYAVDNLVSKYQASKQLAELRTMTEIELTETEFAQVVGRCRMYKHLPERVKKEIPDMLLGDQQLSSVVDAYYHDPNFGNLGGGSISLWRFYNLLTGANKSSYIDSFLERGVNVHDFAAGVGKHKQLQEDFWYMG
jgi:hypothetical protein